MLEIIEFTHTIPTHPITPAGPIPPIGITESVYPYQYYCETGHRPELKTYRMVRLENDFLCVWICPDLGGRVYSLFDKRLKQEMLYVPKAIKPIRRSPRQAWISSGIDVGFPIHRSPIQLSPLLYKTETHGNRLYIWCGEQEIMHGMQWTVEYSLGAHDDFLTQRTFFSNSTKQPRPWTSCTHAVVPVSADTEFHFPNDEVVARGSEIKTIDWETEGPQQYRAALHMSEYRWLNPSSNGFGVFTRSRKAGLYHITDPSQPLGFGLWVNGQKSQGQGDENKQNENQSYVELMIFSLLEQAGYSKLLPGRRLFFTEYWIPSSEPLDILEIDQPQPHLLPISKVPFFGWARWHEVEIWNKLTFAHDKKRINEIPKPPGLGDNRWAPDGLESLGKALAWASSVTENEVQDRWLFQYGAWQAGTGNWNAAIETLAKSNDDRAKVLLGRLYRLCDMDLSVAAACFRSIQSEAIALHPQVMIERDLTLAGLGNVTLKERERWLNRLPNMEDEWLIERKVSLLADQGRWVDAKKLLENTRFQTVIERNTRQLLWRRICKGLGKNQQDPPPSLCEYNLAEVS